MRKRFRQALPFIILLAFVLSACSGSGSDENSVEVLTQAAEIAQQSLTQTAEAAPPTATNTPVPTATNTPLPSPTPTEDSGEEADAGGPTATPAQQQAAGSTAPCYRASFETETVPDGTEFFPNRVFTKLWRLKNTGSCNWEPNFSFIWVQGDLMEADSVVDLTEVTVFPNEYVEVEVRMEAPPNVGTYKGYWMIRSPTGEIFGVGIDGKSWVWVEIKVVPSEG